MKDSERVTVSTGPNSSAQGTFIKELPDGRVKIKIGKDETVTGTPIQKSK